MMMLRQLNKSEAEAHGYFDAYDTYAGRMGGLDGRDGMRHLGPPAERQL